MHHFCIDIQGIVWLFWVVFEQIVYILLNVYFVFSFLRYLYNFSEHNFDLVRAIMAIEIPNFIDLTLVNAALAIQEWFMQSSSCWIYHVSFIGTNFQDLFMVIHYFEISYVLIDLLNSISS